MRYNSNIFVQTRTYSLQTYCQPSASHRLNSTVGRELRGIMRILHNIYHGLTDAIELLAEKNRKNNLINRIRHVICQEEIKANRAYIALGRYYFQNLRQPENDETEFYCKAVEHANHRISRALLKLDEITLDDEDFFCDEDFETAVNDLGFASCENAQEASSWDYTETAEQTEPVKENGESPVIRHNDIYPFQDTE